MLGLRKREWARLLIAPSVFLAASFLLWLLFASRPPLRDGHTPDLHFPTSVEDLQTLVRISGAYKQDHWGYVLLLFSLAYIYKQTFAIPGSALLNLLGGALLGCWPLGYPLCCILTAVGASNCFVLSRLVGKAFIQKKFAVRLAWFQDKLLENKNQMFLFLVSLRVFPMTPNWFLNITAPYVNIPLPIFFLSVLFGLMPYNLLCVQAGEMLAEVRSLDDVFTPKRLLALVTLAMVMLTLSHFARKQKIKNSE